MYLSPLIMNPRSDYSLSEIHFQRKLKIDPVSWTFYTIWCHYHSWQYSSGCPAASLCEVQQRASVAAMTHWHFNNRSCSTRFHLPCFITFSYEALACSDQSPSSCFILGWARKRLWTRFHQSSFSPYLFRVVWNRGGQSKWPFRLSHNFNANKIVGFGSDMPECFPP